MHHGRVLVDLFYKEMHLFVGGIDHSSGVMHPSVGGIHPSIGGINRPKKMIDLPYERCLMLFDIIINEKKVNK